MKKAILILSLFVGLSSLSYAQKNFVNMIVGYSTLNPNSNGYFLHADYTRRVLGIFRAGLGLSSNSFMHYSNGFISHENNLDLEGKLGIGVRIIGFRLEGGFGMAGRYWFRSYATDANRTYTLNLAGQTINMNPGQIEHFSYLSFGSFTYLSIGVDVNDWLGIKAYGQYKRDKFGDQIVNLGGGIYFILQ